MNPVNPASPYVVTLTLTPDQHRWLESAARFIQDQTGSPVSFPSIMMRLMEHGLPQFETELVEMRAQGNAKVKRFPKLQLVAGKTVYKKV